MGHMAEKTFTVEELKQFDGQDGHKAYVAVEGVVYDVTGVEAWQAGKHHGNLAGQDLTDAISQAPHGKAVLGSLPVVGKLA
ncbi:hypothetical protein FC17_GL002368 [Secundilactobacillus paracollinoides DSM 15502 = JCM 11969]|nr:hypothetical protein FC17_GL002368 [Secundilactobacillus paracollinoides DSM 15502 = JCM 11969]